MGGAGAVTVLEPDRCCFSGGAERLCRSLFPELARIGVEVVWAVPAHRVKIEHALGHQSRLASHKLAASDIAGQATMRLSTDSAKNTLVSKLADTLRTGPAGLEKVSDVPSRWPYLPIQSQFDRLT
jgi:hypothetical protein